MFTRIFITTLFVSFGLLQGCAKDGKPPQPEEACYFQQNGYKQRVSWATLPVTLYADASMSEDQVMAVTKAIEIWNDGLRLQLNGQSAFVFGGALAESIGLAEDRRNVISVTQNWDRDSSEQAETLLIWRGTHIYDADIRLNGEKPLSAANLVEVNQLDVVALLVHELGHVLGLAHIESNEYTAMAVSLGFGDHHDRRKIGALELDALKCEY
ncbi:MAG: hypothetical protein K2Q26_11995 [Bdellovibrionales bacterium]|nr:hypothetical protein [Bdellovibrionales bacterium]